MKILTIPEQHEVNLGTYGSACEGFVDAVKSLFTSDPLKKKLSIVKGTNSKALDLLKKELENDLKLTYDNHEWVESHLTNDIKYIKVRALELANSACTQIKKPEEVAKIAGDMLRFVKELAQREKPFIELRLKLIDKIKNEGDSAKIDQLWAANKKQIEFAPYRKLDKIYPAFGLDVKKYKWPAQYEKHHFYTDGEFEAPSSKNAKAFAQAIRSLLAICVELSEMAKNTYIPSWEVFGDKANDVMDNLDCGEDILNELCSVDHGGWEIFKLATETEEVLSIIVCGLYIAMFDKHKALEEN